MRDDAASRVVWVIEPLGDGLCSLTVTHDEFEGATETYRSVGAGWPAVLSGLKTLLETGRPLALPESAHAAMPVPTT